MKAFLAWMIALGLAAGPALAAKNRTDEPKTNGKAPATAGATSDSNRALEKAADSPANSASSTSSTNSTRTSEATEGNRPAANLSLVVIEAELQQLHGLITAQSQQIEQQNRELQQEQAEIQALQSALHEKEGANATAGAHPAVETASAAANSGTAPKPLANAASATGGERSIIGLPTKSAGGQITNQTSPSPLQFRIGSAYITPVGFMDLTGVWRSEDAGTGIGTNFSGIPYGGAGVFATKERELRFSMQNSRIGFRVDANVKGSYVIGYMESDFLGAAPGNLAVSSNSNTLRSRLYWVDVRHGSWEVLGGQTWSLATPNRVGVSPLPGDVFFSYDMDVNYQLGDVWGRIPELRLVYHLPSDKAAFAIALDSPDQYAGGANGSTAFTPPACCGYYIGGEADNGGSTLGPANGAPDVIAKFAFDPSKRLHAEVGGIARFFQLYNQTTATHFSATGGAGFANLDFGLFGGLRVLTHNYWSDGGGRYIFGQAPDFVARADGRPSLVHSGSTVEGLEWSRRNETLFGYYGLLYVSRNAGLDSNGNPIGYGYAGAPSGQNRTVQEATLGAIQNLWQDAHYGTLSLIGQYSYLTRDPWSVTAGNPKNAHLNMIFLDLRYTLPGSAPALEGRNASQ